MSCTCTGDKFLQTPTGEIPWDGVTGGCIVTRNRVICEWCLASIERGKKEKRKQELLAQIKELEGGIWYSELDGESEFVAQKKLKRLVLKQELAGL